MTSRRAKCTSILMGIFLLFGSNLSASNYEDDLELKTGDLFPDIPQKSELYTIKPTVETDGFLTRATVSSKYGDFLAVGPGMLKIRLQEIGALDKLQDFEASEEFKRGAKESAEDKWESLKTAAENPQETLEGIGEGVGRFFKRVARSTKTGVQKVDDVLHERVPGSRGSEGAGARLPGAPEQAQAPVPESKYRLAAKASGSAAVNILGFDDARRKLAKQLQVDPYTTNMTLSKKLDEVTWSIFAGDLGVDIVTSMIPGGTLISSSALVSGWIWDTPPGDLRVQIENILRAQAISQDDIDHLLRHQYYSLTMQAAVASALERMKKVENKSVVMDLLLTVIGVDQARFAAGTLLMLSNYHQQVEPLARLEVVGTVVGYTGGGEIVIPTPVDYLSWTREMEHFSGRPEFQRRKVSLHTAGAVTDTAKSMLAARGWKVQERSGLLKADTAK